MMEWRQQNAAPARESPTTAESKRVSSSTTETDMEGKSVSTAAERLMETLSRQYEASAKAYEHETSVAREQLEKVGGSSLRSWR